VGYVIGSDGEESTRGQGEVRGELYSLVLFSPYLCCLGLLGLLAFWVFAGAGRLGVGGKEFGSAIHVEVGRGEGGQVISTIAKVFHFPGVGERLGIGVGVAEHLS